MISLSLIHFVHGENGDGLVPTLYSSGAFIQGARYYYSTCTFPPFFFRLDYMLLIGGLVGRF